MRRALVIDDCPLTLAMARELLEAAGLEVATAASGMEANQHIYGPLPPDLIFIDVEMPLLRGDRKVRLLKSRHTTHNIPVILMSGKTEAEMIALRDACGADSYLVKPLTREKLQEQIEALAY